jgi:hypothetical protein
VRKAFECIGGPEPFVPQICKRAGLVRGSECRPERGRPIVVETIEHRRRHR